MFGIQAVDRYGRRHVEQPMTTRHRADYLYVPLEHTRRQFYPWEYLKGVVALGAFLWATIWVFSIL